MCKLESRSDNLFTNGKKFWKGLVFRDNDLGSVLCFGLAMLPLIFKIQPHWTKKNINFNGKSFSKIDLQTDFWPQVVIGEVRPEPAWAVVGHEKLSCWLHLSHNLQIFGKLKFEFLISNVKICGSGDLSPLRAGIAGGGNLAPTPHTLVSIPTFKNTKFKNPIFWNSNFDISTFHDFVYSESGFLVCGEGWANNHCWK